MRILILHNTYQHPGGEDTVVATESALLSRGGHNVHVEIVSNDAIAGLVAKARAFLDTPHDASRKEWVHNLIVHHAPDIVHVHNFFPLLTPAIHEAASERKIAVVQTLHNYRLLCAGALFMRGGSGCEKCLHGSNLWGAVHRCYRGSLPGSLAVIRMQNRARHAETWRRHVHRFIALTEFAREKFTVGGLPADRIAVKPNFTSDPGVFASEQRKGALFVGRLSPEKGIDVLVNAWESLQHIPLTIIGDGPEYARLAAIAPAHVQFLGSLRQQEVCNHMLRAQALIMPSLSYEGFPMTIAEAFSCCLPIIASRLGAMAELIEDGVTGRHFAPGDAADLATATAQLFSDPFSLARMGAAARAIYDRLYTPERNLALLENIYTEAIYEMRGNHISMSSDC